MELRDKVKKQNEEQNGEAVFIETACGMLLQICASASHWRIEQYQGQRRGYFPLWGRGFNDQGWGLCH